MALDPAALRPHYSRFLASDRVLLTGHSHQAWPDVAREGLLLAFDDAAAHTDDKWQRAFAKADAVREGVAERIGARPSEIALGASTHELVYRLLSAVDLGARPRLVSTTGEFHSLDRQLRRLAEAGAPIERVAARPVATLAERVAAAIDERTAAVLVSTVLFESSEIVPSLRTVVEAAHRAGAIVVFDGYHAFNVLPQRLAELGPDPIYYTAGGYKYAQWGEGCCFLRVPDEPALRPVFTGWFAEFAHLEAKRAGEVGYALHGKDRFAGATYDPSSHYRAAAVVDFFRAHDLSVERLRALSLAQTGRLLRALDGLDLLTPHADDARAGFIALRTPRATDVVRALRTERVFADARGDVLRLGPAPYVTDDEIDRGAEAVRRLVTGANAP